MAEAIIMPKTGMAMTEGTVIEWYKNVGDTIHIGDVVAQIETDKSTMDLEADVSGTLLAIVHPQGAVVPVTLPIAWVGKKGEAIPQPIQEEEQQEVEKPQQIRISTPVAVAATPAAKRVASEQNIDLATVEPSGKSGEIVAKDVLKITPLAQRIAADKQIDVTQIKGSGHQGKIFAKDVVEQTTTKQTRLALTNIQKITGKRMLQSAQTIPSVTENTKADVTELLALKQQILEQSGIKATVNDLIIKATASALKKHPKLNSTLDGDDLMLKEHVDLGVAVATKKGLLVPVLRQAELYSLTTLVEKMRSLLTAAHNGKLTPDELSGSSFTLSNVGMYGITSFTPIINPPEAAILGVCAIEQLPRFINGTLCERSIMTLSLSFDHRVVDGAEAALFLQSLVALLEQPLNLLV